MLRLWHAVSAPVTLFQSPQELLAYDIRSKFHPAQSYIHAFNLPFMPSMLEYATIKLLFYVTERDSVKEELKLKHPTARWYAALCHDILVFCGLPLFSSLTC